VASTRVATNDLLSGERFTAFESHILTGAVINFNHIERFLEDAGNVALERVALVRDAVERHDSVKVNIAFNGEFAMKNKHANKSIITKNSEIYTPICVSDTSSNLF